MSVMLLEKKGAVAELLFNRPEALNALNEEVMRQCLKYLKEIEADPRIRIVLLKGAGEKAFIAGADIKAMAGLTPTQARDLAGLGQSIGTTLERMPQISIACVDGFALGGGCEMALACDLIYASDKAKFGQPEVNLGVIPGFGGTQRLARAIGITKAKEMLFTGKIIDAAEAKNLGMVCEVFSTDKFEDALNKVISVLLEKGPMALVHSKSAVNQGYALSIEQGCALEKEMFALCFGTQEQREGMDAFLNKRKANFKS